MASGLRWRGAIVGWLRPRGQRGKHPTWTRLSGDDPGRSHQGGQEFIDLVIGHLVVVALVFRALMIPVGFSDLLGSGVEVHGWPLLVACGLALGVLNLWLARMEYRRQPWPWLRSRGFLTADVGLALFINLWFATLLPGGTLQGSSRDLFSPYVIAGMAIWTGLWGNRVGLWLVGLWGATEWAMLAVNHVPTSSASVMAWADRTLWIVAAFVSGSLVASFAARGAALVARQAQSLGRERERTRSLRQMHDTVLQTLEGIVHLAERGDRDAGLRMNHIAKAASDEAARIRNTIRRADEPTESSELYDDLAGQVLAFEARTDVSAEFVSLGTVPSIEASMAQALSAAVGEALRNVEKHAGASRVNVFVERLPDRLRVLIKDNGSGFDPAEVQADALGIAQSIIGRLHDVGGGAGIESRLGSGTRVDLWLPLSSGPDRLGVSPSWGGTSR